MNQNKVIGLTGSISTGKSQVSNYLKAKGFKVIDADKIARDVVDIAHVREEIEKEFGKNLYKNDKLDRKKLGSIVFNSNDAREILNNITHPEIYKIIKDEINNSNRIVFVDLPLLFESKGMNEKYGLEFNEIWVVYVDRDTQIERLMNRDNISRDYAEKKIKSQISVEDKKNMADVVIDNRNNLENTINQVDENLKRLKACE